MMKDKVVALLKSSLFWIAAAGVIAVVGSEIFGVEFDTEQIVGVTTIVAAWIIGDTVRETV